MSQIVGGCLCGNIRYTCEAEPMMMAICHCKNCQKQTSTSFSIVVAVPKGSLNIEGELSAYNDQGTSGQAVIRKFCGKCGSPILSDVIALPTMDFLKAGTLDDTSWLKPEVQLWCDSAQSWLKLDDDSAQIAQNPPMD